MKPKNGRPERDYWHEWGHAEEKYVVEKFGLGGSEGIRNDHDESFFDANDSMIFWGPQVTQYLDRARMYLDGYNVVRRHADRQRDAQRLKLLGMQALAKAATTAHDMVESAIRVHGELPEPGQPSGEISEWQQSPPFRYKTNTDSDGGFSKVTPDGTPRR